MKKTLLAAALAAVAANSSALTLDVNGLSGSGTLITKNALSYVNTQSLILNGESSVASVTTGTLLMQGRGDFGIINSLSFQLSLTGTITRTAGGGGTTDNITFASDATQLSASIYKLFYDPTPGESVTAGQGGLGTGFGNLNGEALNAGQVEIASGNISEIQSGSFKIEWNDTTLAATNPVPIGGGGNFTQHVVNSGSGTFFVDITAENTAYVRSTLKNSGATVSPTDLTPADISDLDGFQNFDKSRVPAYKFVGNKNGNFLLPGADKLVDGTCTAAIGPKSKVAGKCDLQFANSVSSQFSDNPVPEPTTVGMVGLALTVLGFALRRKRNLAA